MGKKQHALLVESFESQFPTLFNFEKCGLLMIDCQDGTL